MRFSLSLLCFMFAAGCHGSPDLSSPLGIGQTRAGVVEEELALFGGIASEGRVGDFKIYNKDVAFVIQGMRPGFYLSSFAGGIVDADVARGPGELGRDIIDDWAPMFGFGRYMKTEQVEVVSDGHDGVAIIRATGGEGPIEYMAGALGLPHNDLGLRFQTDYILRPDTPLLEVVSTIYAGEEAVVIRPGDAIQGSKEVADVWEPGVGLLAPTQGVYRDWAGFVGRDNQVTVGVFSGAEQIAGPSGMDIIGRLMLLAGGFTPEISIPAGQTAEYRRFYGVGTSPSVLTDAWMKTREDLGQKVEGVVSAADGPVAGARVHILLDEAPWTIAVTDESGAFSALVPSTGTVSTRATSAGTGYFIDGALGTASYGPYTTDRNRERVLQALRESTETVPHPLGRGVATLEEPLVLAQPGVVRVRTSDEGTVEVRLIRVDAMDEDEGKDERIVLSRPSEGEAVGWTKNGSVSIPILPGVYQLVVHRGMRFEVFQQEVTVTAGETVEFDVSLEAAYAHPGWVLADPHIHASPSSDGRITMEDRLVNCAGVGLELHFGTDHDHIADYGPLLQPLGIDSVLQTVVADEVSPFARGHINAYPLESKPNEPNGGAWIWWNDPQPSTQAQFDLLHERHPDVLIQINHAFEMGLFGAADWRPGKINKKDYWSPDFEAFEFMNGGSYDEYIVPYFDIVNRGMRVAPMGTSDAHGYAGRLGMSATFMYFGSDGPEAYTPDKLRDVVRQGRTQVTRGVFLDLSELPGSTLVGTTTLSVSALSPNWVTVDRLELLKNGMVVETVAGTEASFILDAESDAVYTVMAHGETPMAPVWDNRTPFAMSAPYFWDREGDGWEPSLPPLVVQ